METHQVHRDTARVSCFANPCHAMLYAISCHTHTICCTRSIRRSGAPPGPRSPCGGRSVAIPLPLPGTLGAQRLHWHKPPAHPPFKPMAPGSGACGPEGWQSCVAVAVSSGPICLQRCTTSYKPAPGDLVEGARHPQRQADRPFQGAHTRRALSSGQMSLIMATCCDAGLPAFEG